MKKNLMKILFLPIVLIGSITLNAQLQSAPPSMKFLEKIKNCTLTVVVNEKDSADAELKRAVQKYWTYCEYRFMSEAEILKNYDKQKDDYYLGYFEGRFDQGKVIVHNVPFVGITNKIRSKYEYLHHQDFDFYYLFTKDGYGRKYNAAYINFCIASMNKYLIKCNSEDRDKKINNAEWKPKKMLICKEDLFVDKSVITATYKFDYEFVSRDRIAQAILNEEDVIVYYINPASIYAYHMFISPKDSQVVYFNYSGSETTSYVKVQPKLFKLIGNLK
ncbi:MAG: hypothetical protein ACRC3B_02235 [Bacteroidia bacterium]